MQVLPTLIRFARKSPRQKLQAVRNRIVEMDWYWKVHKPGNDRTAYVIGLFGTGRWYITEMMLQNIGKRAKYFRYEIRFHSGPTSLIYSGHATIKYVSSMQTLPAVTSRILETVRSRFADLIFVYRHPLDSLLTNWVWWRRYIRDIGVKSTYISDFYKNTDDLCADWSGIFLNSRPSPKATLISSRPYLARDSCLSRNLLRKLSFISNPPRSRCDLRTA